MAAKFVHATGRRKAAVARVRVYEGGTGKIEINNRNWDNYFVTVTQQSAIMAPLTLVNKDKDVDIKCLVDGGGVTGQAGAVRHGISRALIKIDPELRGELKKAGFLTRDPRMKERKKPGQPGARKKFQYSKR